MKIPLPAWPPLAWPLTAALLLGACQAPPAPPADAKAATLPAFADDQALAAAFARMRARAPSSAPMPALPAAADAAGSVAQAPPADTVTNVQTAGVDEGDIVKKQGDYLIVLRRGRLFSLAIGDDGLRAVSAVNAYAPGIDPSASWYDEMLVADGQVVVIGYSYDRGGTEIGLFDLGADGALRYRATYHLRSNDYYSADNYASRLIGKQLIFYSPMSVGPYDAQRPQASLPALRRWHAGAQDSEFERLLPAQRIHYGPDSLDARRPTLHTVTVCDLGGARLRCRSSAALGEANRSFYVAADAVYVWTRRESSPPSAESAAQAAAPRRPDATVFRLPLDGGPPSALRAEGAPIDQMSFLERDGWLNVLVASQGEGDGMWSSRVEAGDLALLRVRLSEFGDGRGVAAPAAYRALPEASRVPGELHARYIGDWLVFGFGAYWGEPARRPPGVYALRYARREPLAQLPLPHWVERVDALGDDAIVVGAGAPAVSVATAPAPPPDGNGEPIAEAPSVASPPLPPLPPMPPEAGTPAAAPDLHFTSLRLDQDARIAGHYLQPQSHQGDQRTHGFFYRRDGERSGLLGLPVIGADARGNPGARVLYLRNDALSLSPAGELASNRPAGSYYQDGCVASCVDWYGNARPVFIGERVFALLGYQLIEGRLLDGRIVERRRVDFTPHAPVSR